MKTKILAFSLTFALMPALASAMCTGAMEHSEQQAMSCADGTLYDVEAGACVPVVTG